MKERAAFQEAQQSLDATNTVWLDEAALNLSMTTSYGRSPAGERVVEHRPSTRTAKTSNVGAMTHEGLVALGTVEGSFNTERFLHWLTTGLLPNLARGTLIIWDNVRFHFHESVRRAVEAAGCIIVKMPPYSPDLNPIEECWSKLKHFVRTLKPRSQVELMEAIDSAESMLKPSDFRGWVRHAGYQLP